MIRLVRPDLRLLDAALGSDDALARALGVAVVPGWVTHTAVLERTREVLAIAPARARWGPRLFIAVDPTEPAAAADSADPPELVGWGGFKGPPADGAVEI